MMSAELQFRATCKFCIASRLQAKQALFNRLIQVYQSMTGISLPSGDKKRILLAHLCGGVAFCAVSVCKELLSQTSRYAR
jgi:hypothetical protein